MRLFRSRIFLALAGVLVLAVGLFVLQYALRLRKLAQLQSAFSATEIYPECHEPARWIPDGFETWLQQRCESWMKQRSMAPQFIRRFRLLTGARIDMIALVGVKVPEVPAAALRPFPGLLCVTLHNASRRVENGRNAPLTTADALRLCTALRGLPDLRAAYLLDPAFDDDGITPLAGHPNLGLIHFHSAITPRSLPLFRSLPSLFAIGLTEDPAIMRREDGETILNALGPQRYRINWMEVEPP